MSKNKKIIDGAAIFVLVLLLIGAFFFIKSEIDFKEANYKVKFFPLILSATLVVLCIAEFFRASMEKTKKEQAEKELEEGEQSKENKESLKKVFMGFLWLAFIPLVTYLLGFYVSMPLFTFLFLRYKKASWKITIILTVIMFCIVFFLFGLLLRMNLYKGFIYIRLTR